MAERDNGLYLSILPDGNAHVIGYEHSQIRDRRRTVNLCPVCEAPFAIAFLRPRLSVRWGFSGIELVGDCGHVCMFGSASPRCPSCEQFAGFPCRAAGGDSDLAENCPERPQPIGTVVPALLSATPQAAEHR